MALIGAAAAVSVACHGRFAPSSAPTTSPSLGLSILTYNVEFNHGTPAATIDAIADANADIICLQESNQDWEGAIRSRFLSDFTEMRFQPPPPNDPGGLAVLSKFPIESVTKLAPGERGWFPACLAIVATPAGRVQILNVHLRPLISDGGSRVKGFLTVESMHRAEIESLQRQLDPNLPTLIVGDFNEGNDGKATQWLAALGFTDVLPHFDRDTPTWHGSVYGVKTSYRDDHVMVTKGLTCTDARVLQRGASDHYPVRATVTFEKP